MKLNAVSLSLVVGLCLSASMVSAGEAGVIRFSGQIVEASCEVVPAAEANFSRQGQLISVSPGVEVMMNTDPNACGGRPAFTTRFEALRPTAGNVGGKSASGTVVVTYL